MVQRLTLEQDMLSETLASELTCGTINERTPFFSMVGLLSVT